MSSNQHRELAQGHHARCAVLTISDTRDQTTDRGGELVKQYLTDADHEIAAYQIVKDEADQIESQLKKWLLDESIQAIITTGGTGIAKRDTTIEVVQRLLNKTLDGFGELFRMLSWEEVGAAAMLSRAVSGLSGETMIFTLPGSTNAVRLAMTKLIIPELPHLIWERKR